MYGVKINGVSYNVAYEYPITYTLDKSLDFGSVNIPALAQKEVFPMYSVVEITRDNDLVEYFLSIGDIVKIASYNPLLYSHTIQLVEYTKKLENYLISASTFTQPTDGSTRYTYYDVIDRLVKISIFETANRETAALPCVLDSSLSTLQNIKAPEFFFYNKTLREALDEVLGTLPAIARLKRINNVDTLFVDYLDATSALINQQIFLSYNGEQKVTNYATTMVSDVTNAIRGTKGNESVTVFPNNNGWAALSTKNGLGVLDNNQSVMNVKQNIYDVVSLEIQVAYNYKINLITGDTITTFNVTDELGYFDLSRFVVTKEQYDALLGSWDTYTLDLPPNITQAEMIEQGYLTKQNAIWFEVGSPFIEGLTTNWRSTAFTTETTRRRNLENAILTALDKDAITDLYAGDLKFIDTLEIGNINIFSSITQALGITLSPSDDARGWESVMFRCVFIPQEKSNRIEVERLDLTNFSKKALSYFKQNANLINLNAYVNKMDADLQRVGEDIYVVNSIISSYGDLLQLGDITSDGYVLMSYTIIQHLDYLEVAYNFSRNYQQINERIAVDKSNDYFELVSGDKVLDRFVTYKDYVVLSDVNQNISISEPLLTLDAKRIYLHTFVADEDPELIESWNMIRFPNVKQYAPVAGSGAGSSLLLSTGFTHNAIAGYVILFDSDTNGYIQSPTFYAIDGELDEFDIEFYDTFKTKGIGVFKGYFNDEAALLAAHPNPIEQQYAGVGADEETADTYTGSAGVWVNINKPVKEYEFDSDLLYARSLPLVQRDDYNTLITNVGKNIGSFKIYKDPGERIRFNYQIQAIVAPDNIGQFIIGNYFHNFNGLVHEPKDNLFITFSSEVYGKGESEQAKAGNFIALTASTNIFHDILNILNTIPNNTNSYAICDSEGKLILAVNRVDGTLPTSIKFTFSHTRPGLQKL
jgi:hypothetical protein